MLENALVSQTLFPELCAISAAIEVLAEVESIDERGAFYTKREVVDFILDLSGYTDDRPLHLMRLLEPSFGNGDFLLPAIERLLNAWRSSGADKALASSLGNAICAVELHRETFVLTRLKVLALLRKNGITGVKAEKLVKQWLVHADFLLADLPGTFDAVVGNPPYVRQELIPSVLLAEYRMRFTTMYDRADLYIPFIERSLTLLSTNGQLGFICADRWMKNRYGGPLRAFIAENYHLKFFVDMVDTDAFHAEVSAYPGIMVVGREAPGLTRVAYRPAIEAKALTKLACALHHRDVDKNFVRELHGVIAGSEPWIFEADDQISFVRRIEQLFPTLEESGCKVSIGVATGADKAFIGNFDALDVEPDRKLPLATTKDIRNGFVEWQGLGVINPYADEGGLVDLGKYPRLRRYLEARKPEIAKRHCAQKSPENWYKTIDRITPRLATLPKLLIPDIKGEAHIVYEDGVLYPHHNLYYITSEVWNLHALQAVLLSGVAHLFVSAYSTKMRGGFLRFQAQYLRRIRVPKWEAISTDLQRRLIAAGKVDDALARGSAVTELYGLSESEASLLEQYGTVNAA